MTRLLLAALLAAVCAAPARAGDKTIEELKKEDSKNGGQDTAGDKSGDAALIKEKIGAADKYDDSKLEAVKAYEKDKLGAAAVDKSVPPDEPGPANDGQGVSQEGGPSSSGRTSGLPRGASPSGGGGRPVVKTPVSAPGAAPTQTSRAGDKAFSRASAAAAAMRSQFRNAEVLGEGGPGAASGAAGLPPAAGGAIVPHDPPSLANPKSEHDLALAAGGGFGAAFKVMGLKASSTADGRPAIVHQDGRPAAPEELDILKKLIVREPAALTRRPDYFSVLPRSRFYKLRKDYETRPALAATAFQDVGMPETRRDFLWSQSCSKVSGGCNPAAQETSYKRGDYVPPEDLNRIWERIKAESAEDDAYSDEDIKAADAEDARLAALSKGSFNAAAGAGLLNRLGAVFSSVTGLFDASAKDGVASPGVPVPSSPGAAGTSSRGPSAAGAPPSAAGRTAGGVPSPADAPSHGTGRGLLLWLAAGAVVAAAWTFGRRS